MADINDLIEKLKGIEDGTVDCEIEVFEGLKTFVDCDEVEKLANELLITKSGCNWKNVRILEKAGYKVYPGDRDVFGWLVGCIDTSKGTITYG